MPSGRNCFALTMFIYETSVNAQIPFNYSRCELGKRCVSKTINNNVFQKFTLRSTKVERLRTTENISF